MTRVVCQAVRWVDGAVEVRLTDARGVERSAVENPAAVDHRGWLSLGVDLPFDIEVACEVMTAEGDLVTVSTAVCGEVEVTPYQLRGGGVSAREIGFYESADEVRAAMAGGEQPWAKDALRYLEQGQMVVLPMAWATDLLDPDGPSVNERGEWTDGVWFWGGTLVHYLRKYHVALPEAFLAHMAANGWEVPQMTDEEWLAVACLRYPFLAEDVAAPVAEA
ncbi:hypothetical protein JNUCC0626_28770 [Lentzea sp. JNUCC 0626]|uniref:hypothetical protein n=1 Tax=Lentzea sp. JNUCC 0626 TaxID=3367513 RepID=UPI003748736F